MNLIVTCVPGLETLLIEELREFGIEGTADRAGSVRIGSPDDATNDDEIAARILVRSRLASRVLRPLRKFSSKNAAMLYDQVRRIDWASIVSPTATVAVFAHGSTQGADLALHFAPLKIKDALCDEIRKAGRERPNVDRMDADIRLEAYFDGSRCELSVDLAGVPLHRRGYRDDSGEAPLRENRAAALLRLAGYRGDRPLEAPFCGSGTIAIEALLIATRTAPGLGRQINDFAGARMSPSLHAAITKEYRAAESERLPRPPHVIAGSDVYEKNLRACRANEARLRSGAHIVWKQLDARHIAAPGALIAANPPWGERLSDHDEAITLLGEFTRAMKHASPGALLALVLPTRDLEKAVGFKPNKKVVIGNGPEELRLLCYEIVAGEFRKRKSE